MSSCMYPSCMMGGGNCPYESECDKESEKQSVSSENKVFECIGYMKHKLPGESDFSMFINENSYGSTGGFQWQFLDFCPDLPHEYGRIFIHTMSYAEIRRAIIHELEMKRTI